MTPEAQRIAIAEACGWQIHHGGKYCSILNSNIRTLAGLFDPLIDLNAMHEAEETLSRNQRAEYWHEIIKLCNEEARLLNDFDRVGIFYQLHAKAAQRAEAFLRTLGGWEESE
jgi:hypothetical protein